MLNSYLRGVATNIKDANKHFQLAMLDIDTSPALEHRYSPVTSPELLFFY